MKEQLITVKTAKLAKKKEFPFTGSSIYKFANILQDSLFGTPLTTQSLLQKWIRENHNFHIKIDNIRYGNSYKWIYDIRYINQLSDICQYEHILFNSYEEALETALQESLKLIK
jgi:hypothetical protein